MPAVPPYIIEPLWEQFCALLPERNVAHPLGCHRTRIPDRVIFEKLVQVLVFGCAYWRISEKLRARGLIPQISPKGKPAPMAATGRWIVERTNSWQNAHKKLVWCTERRARVIDFWMAFSSVVIIVGRIVREAWTRYRWNGRPLRRP